ncbi:hypothetical protein J2S46_000080 [Kitasatospora herbaricolor]|nr:hypothetical protein [Kitasatospora herbaricolor]
MYQAITPSTASEALCLALPYPARPEWSGESGG